MPSNRLLLARRTSPCVDPHASNRLLLGSVGLGRRILIECEMAARREGFTRLSLVATLPGLPLYLGYGFEALENLDVTMPDGVTIPCVAMEKRVGQ